MKAIVVVDKLWGIGRDNDLLFSLKEDMKHFREMTSGRVVVMGKNTLKSLPNGAPLKNRTNIVLGQISGEGFIGAANLDELNTVLKDFNTDDVFVVGGASVYRQLVPLCDCAYVTSVEADGGATVFFPNLDEDKNWKCTQTGEQIQDGEYKIRFKKYEKKGAK